MVQKIEKKVNHSQKKLLPDKTKIKKTKSGWWEFVWHTTTRRWWKGIKRTIKIKNTKWKQTIN